MSKNKIIKVGIVGCGAIGSRLALEIDKNLSRSMRLTALCDIDKEKAKKLISKLSGKPKVTSLNDLVKTCDLIIEAASAKISYLVAKRSVSVGKDVLIMSVGGLLGKNSLFERAQDKGSRIYIPSGAIAGVDAIKAARVAGIKRLTLTTYKGTKSLEGAPYLEKKLIDLSKIKKEKVIFSGPVKEAVKGFPKNVNVSAILSIASGVKDLRVKIVLRPNFKKNMHKVEIEGKFGKVTAVSENLPCPDNRKTSFLAVLSAIAVLRQIGNSVKIGN